MSALVFVHLQAAVFHPWIQFAPLNTGSLHRSDRAAGSETQLVLCVSHTYCWQISTTFLPSKCKHINSVKTRGKVNLVECHKTELGILEVPFLLKKTETTLTHHSGCPSPPPGGTAISHGQLCQMPKRCRMKRMDVFSPHYWNEVIHQCHYSGFICVLACTQVVLGPLQLVKVGSPNSCMIYFLLQAEPSLKNCIYPSVIICQSDEKLSKMLT